MIRFDPDVPEREKLESSFRQYPERPGVIIFLHHQRPLGPDLLRDVIAACSPGALGRGSLLTPEGADRIIGIMPKYRYQLLWDYDFVREDAGRREKLAVNLNVSLMYHPFEYAGRKVAVLPVLAAEPDRWVSVTAPATMIDFSSPKETQAFLEIGARLGAAVGADHGFADTRAGVATLGSRDPRACFWPVLFGGGFEDRAVPPSLQRIDGRGMTWWQLGEAPFLATRAERSAAAEALGLHLPKRS